MDFFKYTSSHDVLTTNNAQMINGATRKMWVERYAEPGEFELVAPLRSNLRAFLPIGTLISHLQTTETMIVENIEVSLNLKEDSQLRITGRSLVAFLEQRLIGVNLARAGDYVSEYTLASDETWHQIVTMINDHIGAPAVADDEIPLITASTDLTTGGTSETRTISPGDILGPVLELLDVDDCGIRSSRSTSSEVFNLDVYQGTDHSKDVIFSWTADDLTASGYLFTNKKLKTTAMVIGRYVWAMVDTAGFTGHKRRMMIVDASDLDEQFSAAPVGGSLAATKTKMQSRGRQKLKSQRDLNITNAEISNLSSYEYRQDYRLGDLVMIEGDFNQQEMKRVTEYAEIEDETGYTSHPTLSDPFDEEE